MRPKKLVLLYCADEDLGAHVAWILEVRCGVCGCGVKVTRSFSPRDFLWQSTAPDADFDCVVVLRTKQGSVDSDGDEKVCSLLGSAKVEGLTVDVRNGILCEEYSIAARIIPGDIGSAIGTLIHFVDMACSRRMGPQIRYSYGLSVIPATFREATAR